MTPFKDVVAYTSERSFLFIKPRTSYHRQNAPPLNYRIGHKRRFSSQCLATLVTRTYPDYFAPLFERIGGAYLFDLLENFNQASHSQPAIDLDDLTRYVTSIV